MYGSKSIASFKINGNTHSLRVSHHAEKRFKERNIKFENVVNDIFNLEISEFMEMKNQDLDYMLINRKNNYSIVIKFNGNRMIIATVINKSNEIKVYGNTKIKIID